MIQPPSEMDKFKQQLRDSLSRENCHSRIIKMSKHENVYICGDRDEMVYFIESGHIKLLMLSPEGKECLLAIYTSGDIFGEMCLSVPEGRMETATAMGFVQYLVTRIAEQQEAITQLVTINSERRLGKVLLQLARKLGKKDPRSLRIEHKISHEELSEMVGTTRPRISEFMRRFLEMGLIEISMEHFLIIKEQKLMEYLAEGM
jgi:CRP-like cAMP-binding protein